MMPEIHVQIVDVWYFCRKGKKSQWLKRLTNFLNPKGWKQLVKLPRIPMETCIYSSKNPYGNYFEIYEEKFVFVNKNKATSGMGGANY
jgi:hypothetical protein